MMIPNLPDTIPQQPFLANMIPEIPKIFNSLLVLQHGTLPPLVLYPVCRQILTTSEAGKSPAPGGNLIRLKLAAHFLSFFPSIFGSAKVEGAMQYRCAPMVASVKLKPKSGFFPSMGRRIRCLRVWGQMVVNRSNLDYMMGTLLCTKEGKQCPDSDCGRWWLLSFVGSSIVPGASFGYGKSCGRFFTGPFRILFQQGAVF